MDIIRRQDAVNFMREYRYTNVSSETIINMIPSAEKTGKWLESTESRFRPFMCSNCGCIYDVDTSMGNTMWNYCPHCGTRMVE